MTREEMMAKGLVPEEFNFHTFMNKQRVIGIHISDELVAALKKQAL